MNNIDKTNIKDLLDFKIDIAEHLSKMGKQWKGRVGDTKDLLKMLIKQK